MARFVLYEMPYSLQPEHLISYDCLNPEPRYLSSDEGE